MGHACLEPACYEQMRLQSHATNRTHLYGIAQACARAVCLEQTRVCSRCTRALKCRAQQQLLRSEEVRVRERAAADQVALKCERERQRAAERAAREQDDEGEFDLLGQSKMMASFEQTGVLS